MNLKYYGKQIYAQKIKYPKLYFLYTIFKT
jgi:hypothetical protein